MVRRTLADTADTDVLARRVIDSYVHNLSGALRDSDSYRLYPHAVEVLNRCTADTTVECALLTGNIREGARLKLEHGGLWDYFSWGVFGDISEERTHLAESARSIILEKNPAAAMRNIIIVGDTSNDILCAKAISATSVAFSGGFEAEHTLREQEPDYLIDDLIRIMDILGRT
jgi:phosphoglycolate phosphatase-like HAD superfamily hydrolase